MRNRIGVLSKFLTSSANVFCSGRGLFGACDAALVSRWHLFSHKAFLGALVFAFERKEYAIYKQLPAPKYISRTHVRPAAKFEQSQLAHVCHRRPNVRKITWPKYLVNEAPFIAPTKLKQLTHNCAVNFTFLTIVTLQNFAEDHGISGKDCPVTNLNLDKYFFQFSLRGLYHSQPQQISFQRTSTVVCILFSKLGRQIFQIYGWVGGQDR